MSVKQAPLDFIRSRMRVDPETGCWRWTGTINYAGYGRCAPWWLDHHIRAHRLSYEFFVGPIPRWLTVTSGNGVRPGSERPLESLNAAVSRSGR